MSVFGRLTCPEGASAGGRLVTVYSSGHGAGRSVAGGTVTEADGSYRLAISAIEVNTVLSARAEGARGAHVAVAVALDVTLSDPPAGSELASESAGRSGSKSWATFAGTVTPARAGALVALQRSFTTTDPQWRTIAFGRVGAQGEFSIEHGFRTPGEMWIRAVVRSGTRDRSASEPVAYEVLVRQNPNLTIQSSSPLVSFGQTVTISGVAAGAEEPVELLARGATGAFEALASTTTDLAGRYAFTEVPQRSTYYRVRDATASSTILPQYVSFQLACAARPTAASAGQAVSFTGTLEPASAGQRVELERQDASGAGFMVLATGVLTGSSYSIAHTFKRPGSYTLRISVAGGRGVQDVASAPFTLQVAPSFATTPSAQEGAPVLGAGEEEEARSSS